MKRRMGYRKQRQAQHRPFLFVGSRDKQTRVACSGTLFPDLLLEIPSSTDQGISRQPIEASQRLGGKATLPEPKFEEFPDNFPVTRELDGGDRFEYDCVRHHAVRF
jgi:hypothetical protein